MGKLSRAEEPEFRAASDATYLVQAPDERRERFRDLYGRWFRRLRFDAPIAAVLAELPELREAASRVTVTAAASRPEERADLAVDATLPTSVRNGRCWIGIRVQPMRFLDDAFPRWLRHELWHVRDMLDPVFAYRREEYAGVGAADRLPQRVVLDRYALLWSLSIDARVEHAGLEPLCSANERAARLARAFPSFPAELRAAVLKALGMTCGLRHPELLDLARQPRVFAQIMNYPLADLDGQPQRGSPCPLCRFPTFHWVDLGKADIEPVLNAIRELYPKWKPSDGVCQTCFDCFAIRADAWI
jgi:hypothetical protein